MAAKDPYDAIYVGVDEEGLEADSGRPIQPELEPPLVVSGV